jgi:hypothetical protein
MSEMKNCPLCGDLAEVDDGLAPMESLLYCYCSNLDCPLHDAMLTIEQWNTRTPDPLLEEMAAALGEAAEYANFMSEADAASVMQALQKYRER